MNGDFIMTDYFIKRSDLDKFFDKQTRLYEPCPDKYDASIELKGASLSIQPADVRENVHGRWIGVPVTQPYIKCSVCGHSCHMKTTIDSWGVRGVDVWNYCPSCGAQMSR